MMRRAALACLVLLTLPLMAFTQPADPLTVRWPTAHRPSDLLVRDASFRTVTLDGLSQRAVARGEMFDSFAPLDLRIGQLAPDVDLLGMSYLDRLPLPVFGLRGTGPDDSSGRDRHLLQLDVVQPVDGVSWTGRYGAVNESGDPGPLSVVDGTAGNIDKMGPDFANSLAWRDGDSWLRALLIERQHFATDPVIRSRVDDALPAGVYPKLNGVGYSLHGGWQNERGQLQALAYESLNDDMVYFPPLEREFPARTRFRGLHAGGWHVFGEEAVRYRLGISDNRLEDRPNELGVDAFWRETTASGELQLARAWDGGLLGMHINADLFEVAGKDHVEGGGYVDVERVGVVRNRFAATLPLEMDWSLHGSAGAGYADTELFYGLDLSMEKCADTSDPYADRIAVRTFLEETPAVEREEWWFWYARGLGPVKVPYSSWHVRLNDPEPVLSSTGLSANIRQRLAPSLRLDAGGTARLWLRTNLMGVVDQDTLPTPRVVVRGETGAWVLDGTMKLTHRLSSKLAHELLAEGAVQQRDDYSGPGTLELGSLSTRYRLAWTPASSFLLHASLRWVNGLPLWMPIVNPGSVVGTSRGKDWLSLDLEFEKSFWEDRVAFAGGLLNLLDGTVQDHPLGEKRHLRLYGSLRVRLDSGLWN